MSLIKESEWNSKTKIILRKKKNIGLLNVKLKIVQSNSRTKNVVFLLSSFFFLFFWKIRVSMNYLILRRKNLDTDDLVELKENFVIGKECLFSSLSLYQRWLVKNSTEQFWLHADRQLLHKVFTKYYPNSCIQEVKIFNISNFIPSNTLLREVRSSSKPYPPSGVVISQE